MGEVRGVDEGTSGRIENRFGNQRLFRSWRTGGQPSGGWKGGTKRTGGMRGVWRGGCGMGPCRWDGSRRPSGGSNAKGRAGGCIDRACAHGVKIRVHGVAPRDNVDTGVSDLFGNGGRAKRLARLGELPPYSGKHAEPTTEDGFGGDAAPRVRADPASERGAESSG